MSKDVFNIPPSLSFSGLNADEDDAIMSGFHSSIDFNPGELQGELREEFGMDIDIPFADHSLMNDPDFGLSFKSSDDLETMLGCGAANQLEDDKDILQPSASSVPDINEDKIPTTPVEIRLTKDVGADCKQTGSKAGKKRSPETGNGRQSASTKAKAAKPALKAYNIRRGKPTRGATKKSKKQETESEDEEEDDDEEKGELEDAEEDDDDDYKNNDDDNDSDIDSQIVFKRKQSKGIKMHQKEDELAESDEDEDKESETDESEETRTTKPKGKKKPATTTARQMKNSRLTRSKVAKPKPKKKASNKKAKQSESEEEDDEQDADSDEVELFSETNPTKNNKKKNKKPQTKKKTAASQKGKKTSSAKKKAVKAAEEEEEEEEAEEDQSGSEMESEPDKRAGIRKVATRATRKVPAVKGKVTNAKKGKAPAKKKGQKKAGAKGKGKAKTSVQQSSSEQDEVEEAESELEEAEEEQETEENEEEEASTHSSEEETEVVITKKFIRKRAAKKAPGKQKTKKQKTGGKSFESPAEESEESEDSSDNVPLEQIRKKPGKKINCQEQEHDNDDDVGNKEVVHEQDQPEDTVIMPQKSKPADAVRTSLMHREPILSAWALTPVTQADDSGSVHSGAEDGSQSAQRRISARVKKPSQWLLANIASMPDDGQKAAAKQKAAGDTGKKQFKTAKEQMQNETAEAPTVVDKLISDGAIGAVPATETVSASDLFASPSKDRLVIDMGFESPDGADGSSEMGKQMAAETGSDTEIASDWNEEPTASSTSSSPIKRSERLREHDEATQEKFKALKRKRAEHEALAKKKSLSANVMESKKRLDSETTEEEMEKEDKNQTDGKQVAKDDKVSEDDKEEERNKSKPDRSAGAAEDKAVLSSNDEVEKAASEEKSSEKPKAGRKKTKSLEQELEDVESDEPQQKPKRGIAARKQEKLAKLKEVEETGKGKQKKSDVVAMGTAKEKRILKGKTMDKTKAAEEKVKEKVETGKGKPKEKDDGAKLEEKSEKAKPAKPQSNESLADGAVKQPTVGDADRCQCRGPGCTQLAAAGSIYCGESCVRQHAQESVELLGNERQKLVSVRSKLESRVGSGADAAAKTLERIVVFERKTGKLVTGPAAPTEVTLYSWLLKHPTFEVLQPGQQIGAIKKDKKPEKKPLIKEIQAKELPKTPEFGVPVTAANRSEFPPKSKPALLPTPEICPVSDLGGPTGAEEMPPRSFYRPGVSERERVAGPDPARISIRNSLRETLFSRANESDDVMVSAAEVKRLALAIEEELFAYYGGVSTNYKHKFRTLITHLKDPKNKGLFRKVIYAEIKPFRLVRLSSESIGSVDLARWKEPDFKRTGITLLPSPDKSVDPNVVDKAPAPDILPMQPQMVSYSVDANYDYLSSIIIDTTPQHGRHFFDVNCRICTGKVPDPLYDDNRKPLPTATLSQQPPPPAAKPVEELPDEVNTAPAALRDFSRDPRRSKMAATASPVVAKADHTKPAAISIVVPPPPNTYPLLSPESILQSLEASPITRPSAAETPSFWKGSIYAQEIAKVTIVAYMVSGVFPVPAEELTETIVITGRLPPENVYNYLTQIRNCPSTNRDVAVIRLQVANDDAGSTSSHSLLFSYLSVRNRCGVVSSWGPSIKDMYVLPLSAQNPVPPVLLPFDGPGLIDDRSDLLLGIIVTHAAKQRPAAAAPAVTTTMTAKASTKTWMYAERTETADDSSKAVRDKTTKTPVAAVVTDTIASPSTTPKEFIEDYTPSRPSLSSRPVAVPHHRKPPVIPVSDDDGSSGQSDADDTQSISDKFKNDPIVSKYSKNVIKKSTHRHKSFASLVDENDERPYDPFADDDSAMALVITSATAAVITSTATSSTVATLTPPQSTPSSVSTATSTAVTAAAAAPAVTPAVIPTATTTIKPATVEPAPDAQSTAPTTSSAASSMSGIDLAQLVDHLTRTGSTPEMTATILSSLVATSPEGGAEEQRQIFLRLTEALRERQRLIEQQKAELEQQTGTASVQPPAEMAFPQTSLAQTMAACGPLTAATATAGSIAGMRPDSPCVSSGTDNLALLRLMQKTDTPGGLVAALALDTASVINITEKLPMPSMTSSYSLSNSTAIPFIDDSPTVTGIPFISDFDSASAVSTGSSAIPFISDAPPVSAVLYSSSSSSAVPSTSTLPNPTPITPSMKQFLSGQSIDDLKNILASVSGALSDGPRKATSGPAAANADNVPPSDLSSKTADTKPKDDSGKPAFGANMHGDIDYRFLPAPAQNPNPTGLQWPAGIVDIGAVPSIPPPGYRMQFPGIRQPIPGFGFRPSGPPLPLPAQLPRPIYHATGSTSEDMSMPPKTSRQQPLLPTPPLPPFFAEERKPPEDKSRRERFHRSGDSEDSSASSRAPAGSLKAPALPPLLPLPQPSRSRPAPETDRTAPSRNDDRRRSRLHGSRRPEEEQSRMENFADYIRRNRMPASGDVRVRRSSSLTGAQDEDDNRPSSRKDDDRRGHRGHDRRPPRGEDDRKDSRRGSSASKSSRDKDAIEAGPLSGKEQSRDMLPGSMGDTSDGSSRKRESSSRDSDDRKALLPTPESVSVLALMDEEQHSAVAEELEKELEKASSRGSGAWKPQSDWDPSDVSRSRSASDQKLLDTVETKTDVELFKKRKERIVSLFGAPAEKIKQLQERRLDAIKESGDVSVSKPREPYRRAKLPSEHEDEDLSTSEVDETMAKKLSRFAVLIGTVRSGGKEASVKRPEVSKQLKDVDEKPTATATVSTELNSSEKIPNAGVQQSDGKNSLLLTPENVICDRRNKPSLLETPKDEDSKPKERKVLLDTPVIVIPDETADDEHPHKDDAKSRESDRPRGRSGDSRSRQLSARRRSRSKSGGRRANSNEDASRRQSLDLPRHRRMRSRDRDRDRRRRRSGSDHDDQRSSERQSRHADRSRRSGSRERRPRDEPPTFRQERQTNFPKTSRGRGRGRGRRFGPPRSVRERSPQIISEQNSEPQPQKFLLPAPHLIDRSDSNVPRRGGGADQNLDDSNRRGWTDDGRDARLGQTRLEEYHQKPSDRPNLLEQTELRPRQAPCHEDYHHQKLSEPLLSPHMESFRQQNIQERPAPHVEDYHHQRPGLVDEYDHQKSVERMVRDVWDMRPMQPPPVEEYHQKLENRLKHPGNEMELRGDRPCLDNAERPGRMEFGSLPELSAGEAHPGRPVLRPSRPSRFHPYDRPHPEGPPPPERGKSFYGGYSQDFTEDIVHRETDERSKGERRTVASDERGHRELENRGRFMPTEAPSAERGPLQRMSLPSPASSSSSAEGKKPLLGTYPSNRPPPGSSPVTSEDTSTSQAESAAYRLKAPPRMGGNEGTPESREAGFEDVGPRLQSVDRTPNVSEPPPLVSLMDMIKYRNTPSSEAAPPDGRLPPRFSAPLLPAPRMAPSQGAWSEGMSSIQEGAMPPRMPRGPDGMLLMRGDLRMAMPRGPGGMPPMRGDPRMTMPRGPPMMPRGGDGILQMPPRSDMRMPMPYGLRGDPRMCMPGGEIRGPRGPPGDMRMSGPPRPMPPLPPQGMQQGMLPCFPMHRPGNRPFSMRVMPLMPQGPSQPRQSRMPTYEQSKPQS